MAELPCLFLEASSYSAVDLRRATAAVLGGRSFEAIAPGTGAIGRGHGVLSADALNVTPSLTPDQFVHVAPGFAAVRGSQIDSQGTYLCPLDDDFDLEVPPKDSSLTTNHYVVAQVKDAEYAAHTGDVWTPEIVEGTPGGGNPSVPEDCLVLARLTIPGGTTPASTQVTSTDITDMRPHARATGGITPVGTSAEFPNPQLYDVIWEISTGTLLIRLGSGWVSIAKNLDANWTTYTPTFASVSLGNGSKYGRYQRFGRTILGVAGFDLGTITGGGNVAGGITCTIPVPAYNPGSTVRYMGFGRAFIAGSFYSCTAEIWPSFNASLMFNFATAGLAAWDTNNPANWGATGGGSFNASQLRIFFTYEAA